MGRLFQFGSRALAANGLETLDHGLVSGRSEDLILLSGECFLVKIRPLACCLITLLPLPALAETGIPLPEGIYTMEGMACGDVNAFMVARVHDMGVDTPQMKCRFSIVEPQEAGNYHFLANCTPPASGETFANEGTVTVTGEGAFSISDGFASGSYSYCAPDSLPAELR